MAISFIGSRIFANDNASNAATSTGHSEEDGTNLSHLTLALDDVVVVGIARGSAAASTPSAPTAGSYLSAFSTLGSVAYGNDSDDVNLHLFAAKFTSLPTLSTQTLYTVGASGSASEGQEYIGFILRGVDFANLSALAGGASRTNAVGTNSALANAPSATPTVAGSWVAVFGAGGYNAAFSADYGTPGDLSATTSHWRTGRAETLTQKVIFGAGLKTNWTSGAFDPAAWTGPSTNNRQAWAASTLVIPPTLSGDQLFAGTGSIVLGSSAALAVEKTFSGTGATALGGSVSLAVDRLLAGTGATTFGSSAAFNVEREVTFAGTGAITLAGAGGLAVDRGLGGTGATTLGATSALAVEKSFAGTGATVFASSALLRVDRLLSSTAGIAFGASVGLRADRGFAGTGAIVFADAGSFVRDVGFAGSGTIVFAGTAILEAEAGETLLSGSGSIAFGGEAALRRDIGFEGSGATQFGSTVTVANDSGFAGSGQVAFGASASANADRGFGASASITFGGVAVLVFRLELAVPDSRRIIVPANETGTSVAARQGQAVPTGRRVIQARGKRW